MRKAQHVVHAPEAACCARRVEERCVAWQQGRASRVWGRGTGQASSTQQHGASPGAGRAQRINVLRAEEIPAGCCPNATHQKGPATLPARALSRALSPRSRRCPRCDSARVATRYPLAHPPLPSAHNGGVQIRLPATCPGCCCTRPAVSPTLTSWWKREGRHAHQPRQLLALALALALLPRPRPRL